MTSVARRRLLLIAGALLAFALGAVLGAGGDGGGDEAPAGRQGTPTAGGNTLVPPPAEQEPEAPVDRLSLRRQVGQVVVLRFAGTTAPDYVLDALSEQRAAGVILFRDNVTSPEQLRALTRSLREAGGDDTLVMVDQEGGEIRILPWAPPLAAAPAQQAAGTVRSDARAAAGELSKNGVNVTLAPVGDVPTVDGAALGGRAFSDDPATASEAMAEAVRGWQAGGVLATAKHFPGLGGATVNTDDGPATIERSREELDAVDLPPFAAAIEAGVPLVMIGHARYPRSTPTTSPRSPRRSCATSCAARWASRASWSPTRWRPPRRSPPATSRRSPSARCARRRSPAAHGPGLVRARLQHLFDVARDSAGLRLRVRESAARVLELKATSDTPAS